MRLSPFSDAAGIVNEPPAVQKQEAVEAVVNGKATTLKGAIRGNQRARQRPCQERPREGSQGGDGGRQRNAGREPCRDMRRLGSTH